jgi:hypothetical protein
MEATHAAANQIEIRPFIHHLLGAPDTWTH